MTSMFGQWKGFILSIMVSLARFLAIIVTWTGQVNGRTQELVHLSLGERKMGNCGKYIM